MFQNIFHWIEKLDIICIQDDQCDILWKWITWINQGCLFAIRKQNIKAFLSTHTLTIDPFHGFVLNLVLKPPISFSKNYILNSASVFLISSIISPVGFCLALTLHEKCGVNHIIGLDTLLPSTILYWFLLHVMMLIWRRFRYGCIVAVFHVELLLPRRRECHLNYITLT